MDKKTLATYDAHAAKYADDWLSQPTPAEIHEIVKRYFAAGEPCADIGCGSGREIAWLTESGFPCTGFDASRGLLEEARRRLPQARFEYAALPDLKEIADASFAGVLCETVLMHLPASEHIAALENLLRILRPGGVVSLSWRLAAANPSTADSQRETDGRLYEKVDEGALLARASALGASCLHKSTIRSPSSGKVITQMVFRKRS